MGQRLTGSNWSVKRLSRGNGWRGPWLSLQFNKVETIDYIALAEQGSCPTRKIELQYDKDGEWKTFFTSGEIGMDCAIKCHPIQTSRVRLRIMETADKAPARILKFEAHYLDQQ